MSLEVNLTYQPINAEFTLPRGIQGIQGPQGPAGTPASAFALTELANVDAAAPLAGQPLLWDEELSLWVAAFLDGSTLVGTVAIANGGTGASTAAGARAALEVPSAGELADVASNLAALDAMVAAHTHPLWVGGPALDSLDSAAEVRGALSVLSSAEAAAAIAAATASLAPFSGARTSGALPRWDGTGSLVDSGVSDDGSALLSTRPVVFSTLLAGANNATWVGSPASNTLRFNVPSGGTHLWTRNGSTVLDLDASDLRCSVPLVFTQNLAAAVSDYFIGRNSSSNLLLSAPTGQQINFGIATVTGANYSASGLGVGAGNTASARRLEVLDSAAPQQRWSYSALVYAERQVDASGYVIETATGNTWRWANGAAYLELAAAGSVLTATSTRGYDLRCATGYDLYLRYGATIRLRVDATGIGFFNRSPAASQTLLAPLTNSTGGTPSTTITAVSGTYDAAEHNNNNASFAARLTSLEAKLVATTLVTQAT